MKIGDSWRVYSVKGHTLRELSSHKTKKKAEAALKKSVGQSGTSTKTSGRARWVGLKKAADKPSKSKPVSRSAYRGSSNGLRLARTVEMVKQPKILTPPGKPSVSEARLQK